MGFDCKRNTDLNVYPFLLKHRTQKSNVFWRRKQEAWRASDNGDGSQEGSAIFEIGKHAPDGGPKNKQERHRRRSNCWKSENSLLFQPEHLLHDAPYVKKSRIHFLHLINLVWPCLWKKFFLCGISHGAVCMRGALWLMVNCSVRTICEWSALLLQYECIWKSSLIILACSSSATPIAINLKRTHRC